MSKSVEKMWREITAAGWGVDVALVDAAGVEHADEWYVRVRGGSTLAADGELSVFRPTLDEAITEAHQWASTHAAPTIRLRPERVVSDFETQARKQRQGLGKDDRVEQVRQGNKLIAQRVIKDGEPGPWLEADTAATVKAGTKRTP